MAILIWKNKSSAKRISPTPFRTEEKFEELVFKTPEILEGVFLLKRQVYGGNKTGIPDMVGVDNDGNICIVEMKNVPVTAEIIPQLLRYAIWAESNPDSIKSLWLQDENRPDDISIDWDSAEIRIIVIAPQIMRATTDFVNSIKYDVELIEVTQWIEGSNVLLHVNHLEMGKSTKPKPVSGKGILDAKFYKKSHNHQSVDAFLKYVADVERLIKKNRWKLETNLTKTGCSFKSGFFKAFGIRWLGTKSFVLFARLTEEEAGKLRPKMTKYNPAWDQPEYTIDPGKTKVASYEAVFKKAYKKLTE